MFINFFDYLMEHSAQILPGEVVEAVNKIIDGINSGETVIFCGAGISRNSGLPVVNQLVPHILEKLEVSDNDANLILDKDNYPRVPFEVFMQYLQENSNLERIFDIYNQGEPNTNHILFAKLIKAGKLKTIVTTNFDKLIEKALSMEPKALRENEDYDVIYTENDFLNINWSDNRIRLIKIHGSAEDKAGMAITLKQVASQILSKPRAAVIEHVFSKGTHKNVLVLGYSSSDVFDISKQIQTIVDTHKKVYYLQHSNDFKIEDIQGRTEKNPFKHYKDSYRLYYNTDRFIKILWESILDKRESYELKTGDINWKMFVHVWYSFAMGEQTKAFKHAFPAYIYLQIGEFKTAIKFFEQGVKVAQEIGQKQKEGAWFGSIGTAYLSLGEFTKSIEYFEQALKIAQEIRDKQNEGIWVGSLGTAYSCVGEFKKAIVNFELGLKIAQQISDKRSETDWLGSIGCIYMRLADYRRAVETFEQALNIAQATGDKRNEGRWVGSLGTTYWRLEEYTKAKEFVEQALQIAQELGDKENEGAWLGSLGTIYMGFKEYAKATKNFEQALQVAQEIGDKEREGVWIGSLGNIFATQGEYWKAIENFEQGLKIAREIGDKKNEERWIGSLGSIYWDLQEPERAIEFVEQAVKMAQEMGDKHTESSWLRKIGRFYDMSGEYVKAVKYYEQALTIFKSMPGDDHFHTKNLEHDLEALKLKLGQIVRDQKLND